MAGEALGKRYGLEPQREQILSILIALSWSAVAKRVHADLLPCGS
jgi:hypothetical protein